MHGAEPSRFQDLAMRGQAINFGAFFQAQPDTTAKLAGFAFAFEHLEIAAYEQLRRVGRGEAHGAGAREVHRRARARRRPCTPRDLRDTTLSVTASVRATAGSPVPIAFGFHPPTSGSPGLPEPNGESPHPFASA